MNQRARPGAPPRVLEDGTPLNGSRIDVGRRVGWVLRTARHLAPSQPRLQDIATAAGTSVSVVHRVEMGTVRSGRVTDVYEQVLALPAGTLRAPIDIVCRTFPYSPTDRDPGPAVTTVAEMSRLHDRVLDTPRGGDWLLWARALSQPAAIGLPADIASTLIHKLISEMDRSVAGAYTSRYEALALMRCGAYGDVMLDVARARVEEPHVQFLADLMSAVGERVTADALAWCLELLRDPRDRVITAAALGLENMGEVSHDPTFWSPLIEPLLEIYNQTSVDSDAWRWLSHLLRLVPPDLLAGPPVRPVRPLAPAAHAIGGAAGPYDSHLQEARTISMSVTAALGMRDEPMLARLLYDILFGPHETRAVTSYMLLSALPVLTEHVAERAAELAQHHADPVIRERVARRLPGFAHASPPRRVHDWLAGDDAQLRHTALRIAGLAGVEVSDEVLLDAISRGPREAALSAAGMTGHRLLARLATDVAVDEDLRGAAQWWIRAGGRVDDATA